MISRTHRHLSLLVYVVAIAGLPPQYGLYAAMVAGCRTEPDARNLSDELRALLGLMRSVPRNRPDLLRAFAGVQVTQQSLSVKVTVDIPRDLVERLLDGAR